MWNTKDLRETDPEFMERAEHFALEEVPKEAGQQLDDVTRYLAILATLLGCQGREVFQQMLPRRSGRRRHAGNGKGGHLSGGGLPWNRKSSAISAWGKPGAQRKRHCSALRGAGNHYDGKPAWRWGVQTQAEIFGPRLLEGAWKTRPYQPLAGGELLRRLLHQKGTGF